MKKKFINQKPEQRQVKQKEEKLVEELNGATKQATFGKVAPNPKLFNSLVPSFIKVESRCSILYCMLIYRI